MLGARLFRPPWPLPVKTLRGSPRQWETNPQEDERKARAHALVHVLTEYSPCDGSGRDGFQIEQKTRRSPNRSPRQICSVHCVLRSCCLPRTALKTFSVALYRGRTLAEGNHELAFLATGIYGRVRSPWRELISFPISQRRFGTSEYASFSTPIRNGLIVAGGVIYTSGVGFYSARRLRYSHFIWHLFVLAGSACHAVAVYGYSG